MSTTKPGRVEAAGARYRLDLPVTMTRCGPDSRDVPLGAAGENIVVKADGVFKTADLGDRIIIRGRDGEVALNSPRVAKPCLPFTSYMLDLPAVGTLQEIGYDLAFLDAGMRGFIVDIEEGSQPFRVRVGDEVLLRSPAE